MAKGKHRLTNLFVNKHKTPGVYADGGGLYLQLTVNIEGDVRRSWLLRFRSASGKVREMGLGSADAVSIADAREAAEFARKLAQKGSDPIEARKEARTEAAKEKTPALTFKQVAETYIEMHSKSWRNPKHRQQWRNTLATYVYPAFGDKPVSDITRADLVAVLEPLWAVKTETASRIQNRVLAILEFSVARDYRTADDPTAWRKYLQKAFPPRAKSQTVKHHPALPHVEVSAFVGRLQASTGMSARALEFVILTASRTNETLLARWAEIDTKKAVWTIPAYRMKSNREHRVPLSPRALAILAEVEGDEPGEWVFPGRDGRPLSSMSLLMLLRRMKRSDITVHGFRSTFRDWVAESTDYSGELAEKALAHALSNQTEAAYQRGDMLDKRRDLMREWSDHCSPKKNVKLRLAS